MTQYMVATVMTCRKLQNINFVVRRWGLASWVTSIQRKLLNIINKDLIQYLLNFFEQRKY